MTSLLTQSLLYMQQNVHLEKTQHSTGMLLHVIINNQNILYLTRDAFHFESSMS